MLIRESESDNGDFECNPMIATIGLLERSILYSLLKLFGTVWENNGLLKAWNGSDSASVHLLSASTVDTESNRVVRIASVG